MANKFEDLSAEQQREIKKLGRNFVIKMLLNGVNFGGLIFLSNLVLILTHKLFLDSIPALFLLCVSVDILLLHGMQSKAKRLSDTFKEQVQKIVKTKE